jgi:hypothetical protein
MDYEKMSVKELRQETRDRGLGLMYLGELKKKEIIEALVRTDKGMSATKPLAGWDDYGRRKPIERCTCGIGDDLQSVSRHAMGCPMRISD